MAGESTGFSRRELLGAGAAAIGAALGGAFPSAADAQVARGGAAAEPTEELVLVNGTIHTMDGNDTVASSVSVRNGRFSAVDRGTPAPRPGIRVIDLRGRAVVKGGIAYVGLDDLIAMKHAAGRDLDHIDIRALEEARGATS